MKKPKEQKFNHLANAEMDEEGNYNMIDGIINNTKKEPPSVLRQLEAYERKTEYHIETQNERRKEANQEER